MDITTMTLGDLVDGDYLSGVHFDGENWKSAFSITNNNTEYITIPEDAYYIYFAKRIIGNDYDRLPSEIRWEIVTHTDGALDDTNKRVLSLEETVEELTGVEERVEAVEDTLYGELGDTETDGFLSAKLKQCSVDYNRIFMNGQASTQRAFFIDVSGYDSVEITPGIYSTYLCIAKDNFDITSSVIVQGSVFRSTYMATECDGYTPNGSSLYRMKIAPETSTTEDIPKGTQTITLSDNAKWLIVAKNYSDTSIIFTPSSIKLKVRGRSGGLVDKESESGANGTLVSFSQGYMDDNGNKVDSSQFVLSSPIPLSRGVLITLHEPYRVHGVMMFDNNGTLVNPRDYYNSIENPNSGLTFYSSNIKSPQYNVRLRIGTSEEDGLISVGDNIIKEFAYLDDSRLRKTLPEDQVAASKFAMAKRRMRNLLNVVYTPLENFFITNSSTNYGKKGHTMRGVPYSEAAEYTKYVGHHVSIRTFLTAMLNRRSLMYTEQINSSLPVSKYGISYHGSGALSGAYYGTVCSGLTCYVQGMENLHATTQLGSMPIVKVNGIDVKGDDSHGEEGYYPYPNGVDPFDVIQPLDIILYTGHISIVSDVIYDDEGNRKYIVWTEQNTPTGKSRAYTRELFKKRIVDTMKREDRHAWSLRRYEHWDIITEPESYNMVQLDFTQYSPAENPTIDPDITTFAGEYAAFAIGDPSETKNNFKMFLNIHRGGSEGYTKLQVFNESDDESATPIAELPLAAGSDYVAQSAIYPEDVADNEDWITFDLMAYWYNNISTTTGKFKARIVREESGDIVIASGFAHFEMVGLSFNVTNNGGSIKCDFSTDNGTPYLIRQEVPDGMSNNDYELKSSDVEAGSKTLSWSSFSTYNYVKLFVKADYGVVVKRIDMNE